MNIKELNEHLVQLNERIAVPVFPGKDKKRSALNIKSDLVAISQRANAIMVGVMKDLKKNKFDNLKRDMTKVGQEVDRFLKIFK